jgi:hypothetical protein
VATKDNLPAILLTPRDVAPAAHQEDGSLMARGLEAIKARQAITVPFGADLERLLGDAIGA